MFNLLSTIFHIEILTRFRGSSSVAVLLCLYVDYCNGDVLQCLCLSSLLAVQWTAMFRNRGISWVISFIFLDKPGPFHFKEKPQAGKSNQTGTIACDSAVCRS